MFRRQSKFRRLNQQRAGLTHLQVTISKRGRLPRRAESRGDPEACRDCWLTLSLGRVQQEVPVRYERPSGY